MKIRNQTSFCLIALALASASAALDCAFASDALPNRIRFTTLSKNSPSGIKSDYVRDLVQDIRGTVWIATDEGLSSFDGWETSHFVHAPSNPAGLSSNNLTALAAPAGTGPVWVGTSDRGLIRFDPATRTSISLRHGTPDGSHLRSNNVTDLAIARDRDLWIGTDQGLCRIDLTTEEIETADGELGSSPITYVTVLRDSEIWVGTLSGRLYKWNETEETFSLRWTAPVPVTAVTKDADNRVWVGTDGNGLYSLSSDESNDPRPVGLDETNITALYVDSRANLWVGTANGLALLNRDDQTFSWFRHHHRYAESLTDNHVTAIYEDRSRMLWISTVGGGTSRFHLEREWFDHLRVNLSLEHSLPDPAVRSVLAGPDETIWFGTDKGLAVWHTGNRRYREVPVAPSPSGDRVSAALVESDGTVWMGIRGSGLNRWSPSGEFDRFRHNPDASKGLGHNNVSSLLKTSAGEIFVGTMGGGLQRYLPGSGDFETLNAEQEKRVPFVNHHAEDRTGHLWVASTSGVFILPRGGAEMVSLDTLYPGSAPLSSPRVTFLLPDANGIIWLGTLDAGLDRFNTATGEVTNFNAAIHGLPDNEIQSLVKDDDGFLWVASRSGISRLNSMHNEFRLFSPDDGLQEAGFLPGAVARDSLGRLYFGGLDGVNIIDPKRLPAEPRVPTPVLTSFEYFGERVVPEHGGILEKELAATERVRLPFDPRTRFSINFGSLDYRDPNSGQFRYLLRGHDLDWQLADEKRKATYSGLPPGEYQFLVQSSVDGREWAAFAAKVNIRITPPWWQTWWFRLLCLCTLVLGTVLSTKMLLSSRVRHLRRREQLLTAQRDKAEAELARQLQNRMLIERTTRRPHHELKDDQILNDALAGITAQFEATHCLVHRIVSADSPENGLGLKRIGFFGFRQGGAKAIPPVITIDHPLICRILRSDAVITISPKDPINADLSDSLGESGKISILASKTRFLDNANGIITIFRVGKEDSWTPSDIKLLEALSGQLGIAIAQLDTAETEEKYRQHLEEAKHEAEIANRAKSDFLAKMTHELRTPLNAIIGFSEILGEDQTLNPKQRETINIINNSGEHLLDVINEILDLSKIEAGKMEMHAEAFSFVPLLKSVYEMLTMKAESKRIGFNFLALSEMPGEVLTDRSKLRQILINLIGNAIKFTAQGAVSLSVKAVALSAPVEIDHRFRRRLRLEFEVRDTGRGITEEEIPRLFERYSQTESGRRSSEGTGLGLPIARSFIQLLGGDVEVSSVFGEGTTFRFHIECEELSLAKAADAPLSLALDETTAQRIIGFEGPREEVRILIAEDQPTNRLLLKKILGKAGFVLAEAENGQEAIEKWNDWNPHLILMDEDMPLKKGSEATREIKSLAGEENNPIIVSLTAYALQQARESAIEAGCSDFVAKPFRSHELFSVISKHLGLRYIFKDAA